MGKTKTIMFHHKPKVDECCLIEGLAPLRSFPGDCNNGGSGGVGPLSCGGPFKSCTAAGLSMPNTFPITNEIDSHQS